MNKQTPSEMVQEALAIFGGRAAKELEAKLDKRREAAARQKLRARGFSLQKSRAQSPRVADFGRYRICDAATNTVVAGESPLAYSMDLEQVEAWIADEVAGQ